MDRQTEEVIIKKIPFKCVVCNGFGTVASGRKPCPGCDGKGYIIVDQDGQTDKTKHE